MWLLDRVSSTGWPVRVSDQRDSMSTRGTRGYSVYRSLLRGQRWNNSSLSLPSLPSLSPRPQCPTAFYCICIRTCMYVAVCRSLKSAARLPTPRRVPSADRLLPPPTTHRRHLKEVFFLLCSIFLTTSRADFSVLSMKISQLSSRSAEAVFRQSILDWPESNCVFFWGRGGGGGAETIFLWETKNLLENIYWRSCVQKSSCLFQKWFDILVSEWNLANQF